MKYGIMYYKETENIGDDIQTYVAKRFLPHIDYFIDREHLNCFIPEKKEYVSMIMNGWFLDVKAAWPPSPYIHPLLVSMHFSSLDKIDVGEKYLQGFGGDYLREHQPIGCRDTESQKKLKRNCNADSFFSGCMTLTMNPFEGIEKKDYICLADLDEESAEYVKKHTKRPIKMITHDVDKNEIKEKSFETRMKDVEELLKTYQAAHLVITSRLHIALPCTALGTPVILVHKKDYDKDRLQDFLKFVTSFVDTDFRKTDITDMLENPKENSKEYIPIRNGLIKRCEEFINQCEKEEKDVSQLPDIETYKEYVYRISYYRDLYDDLRIKAKKNIFESEDRYAEYAQIVKNDNETWKKRYDELYAQYEKERAEANKSKEMIEEQKKAINAIYDSKGWKLLEKLRKLKKR